MFEKLKTGGGTSSVVYIVLGLILLLFPGTATNVITRLVGVAALIYGITRVIDYTKGRSDTVNLVIGIVIALGGLILVFSPAFILSILPVVLGIYIIVEGINELRSALNMRSQGYDRWAVSLCLSLLVLLAGLIILIDPFRTVIVGVRLFGGAMIVAGITGMMEQQV